MIYEAFNEGSDVVDLGSDSGDGASDSELYDGYGDGMWIYDNE